MGIRIIADSCCDLPGFEKNDWGVQIVPLKITVGDNTYTDNGSIVTTELISAMKACPTSPSTACPSPAEYADAMSGDDDVIVVTLSANLSGSYQSACAGAEIKQGSGRVHVLNSQSASAGEVLLVHYLRRLIAQGLDFSELVKSAEILAAEMRTFFVLESLDNLVKNGRISRLAGQLATILHMRPIMSEDGEGNIIPLEKIRGTHNALRRMSEIVGETAEKVRSLMAERDTLVIAHCNCPERAEEVKSLILKSTQVFRKIFIVPTAGLSTVYAYDGGVVVAC